MLHGKLYIVRPGKQQEHIRKGDNVKQTTNYGLNKPESTDTVDIAVLNENMDIIDEELDNLKQSVSDGKSVIASAITDMRVPTASDATFATMQGNIRNITYDANADASNVLADKTFYAKGYKTGTMPNNGAVSQALNAGGSYTIPAGYHNGSGKVTANSLASQTAGTATADTLLSGVKAWVGGVQLTGTMPNNGSNPFVGANGADSTAFNDTTMVTGGGANSYVGAFDLNIKTGYTSAGACRLHIPNLVASNFIDTAKVGWSNFYIQGSISNRGQYQGGCSSAALYENKVYLRFPAGYYNGGSFDSNGGAAECYIPYADLSGLIGLTAGKLATGQTVCGVTGTFTSDATAATADLLSGKTAYANGTKLTGTMANQAGALVGPTGVAYDNSYFYCGPSLNGYYTTASRIRITPTEVANTIGLTASKLVSGNTVLGITGTGGGRKYASGSGFTLNTRYYQYYKYGSDTSWTTGSYTGVMTISTGLSWIPSMIKVKWTYGAYNFTCMMHPNQTLVNVECDGQNYINSFISYFMDGGVVKAVNDGATFYIPAPVFHGANATNLTWEAWE